MNKHSYVLVLVTSLILFGPRLLAQCSSMAGSMSVDPLEGAVEIQSGSEYTLCYGNSIRLDHDDNANLSGDPDPVTQAGVAYMVFRERPTAQGSDWLTIINQNQVLEQDGQPLIIYGNSLGDNAIFQNFGDIPGLPLSVWVAPITINNFSSALAGDPSQEGSCVDLNTDAAIKINLLKRIDVDVISTSESELIINISGGLPELDGSASYTVEVSKIRRIGSQQERTEVLNDNNVRPNADYTIQVDADTMYYEITVRDNGGCSQELSLIMDPGQTTPEVPSILEIGCSSAKTGDTVDIPVYMYNQSIISTMAFTIGYDPQVLQFVEAIDETLNDPPLLFSGMLLGGRQGAIEIQYNHITTDFPFMNNNNLLFTLRFVVVGDPGDQTEVSFTDVVFSANVDAAQNRFVTVGKSCVTLVQQDLTQVNFNYTACTDGNGMVNLHIFDILGTAPYNIDVVDASGASISGFPIQSVEGEFEQPISVNFTQNPHRIIITSADGNMAEEEVYFSLSPLSLDLDIRNSACGNNRGLIDVLSVDGLANMTSPIIQLSSEGGTTRQGDRFENLPTGEYNLLVIDQGNQCRLDSMITIIDTRPNFIIDIDNSSIASCNDPTELAEVRIVVRDYQPNPRDQLRSLRVQGIDPNLGYDTTINNSAVDTFIFMLPVGEYSVRAEDASGTIINPCIGDTTFAISPGQLDSNSMPIQDTFLVDNCPTNGTINGEVIYTFNNVYTDLIVNVEQRREGLSGSINRATDEMVSTASDSTLRLSDVIGNVTHGIYTITIEHPSFCLPVMQEIRVEDIDLEPELESLYDCIGTRGPYIRINDIPAADKYGISIIWSGDTTAFVPGIESDNLMGITGQTFRFTILEPISGCTRNESVDLASPGVEFELRMLDSIICPGSNSGVIALVMSDSVMLDSIRIVYTSGPDDTLRFDGPFVDGDVLENLREGTMIISGFSNGGCPIDRRADIFEVPNIPTLIRDDIVIEQPICAGDSVTLRMDQSNLILNGADPADITYSIGFPAEDDLPLGIDQRIALEPGTYALYIEYEGCFSDGMDSFTIEPGGDPRPVLEQDQYVVTPGTQVEINVAPGTPSYSSYEWILGSKSLTSNPPITLDDLMPEITDTLYLIVTDDNGCTGVATALIIVEVNGEMQYPNIFTPESGDLNALFKPRFRPNNGIERVESIEIFNRKGHKVWEDRNIEPQLLVSDNNGYGWDGTAGGQDLPSDVYAFVVRVKYRDQVQLVSWSGSVMLLR